MRRASPNPLIEISREHGMRERSGGRFQILITVDISLAGKRAVYQNVCNRRFDFAVSGNFDGRTEFTLK
jgi:hypothetical protein